MYCHIFLGTLRRYSVGGNSTRVPGCTSSHPLFRKTSPVLAFQLPWLFLIQVFRRCSAWVPGERSGSSWNSATSSESGIQADSHFTEWCPFLESREHDSDQ